jgi:hypothetical protein
MAAAGGGGGSGGGMRTSRRGEAVGEADPYVYGGGYGGGGALEGVAGRQGDAIRWASSS